MKLRNFLSWFASSIIAFIIMLLFINIVTGLFVDISMQRTLPLIIGSVYDYASPDAQNLTKTRFESICTGVSQVATLQPTQGTRPECLPQNQQKMKAICDNITQLPLAQQQQLQVPCTQVTDGTLQKSCEQKVSSLADPQIQVFVPACTKLTAHNITTRDFLIGPLATVLLNSINDSLNSVQDPQMLANISQNQHINPDVVKYAVQYIQGQDKENYLLAKIITIVLLFMLWFVVSADMSDYLRSVSRMFFSTGMLVFSLWLISFVLVFFFTPNTTALLLLISGGGPSVQPPLSEIVGVLPVVVLQLTSDYVLLIAAASICIAFLLYLVRRYYVDTRLNLEQSSKPLTPEQLKQKLKKQDGK